MRCQNEMMPPSVSQTIWVNDQAVYAPGYKAFHHRRIASTVQKLREIGAKNIVEIGAHPWVMTAALVDEPGVTVRATVSAEEVMHWPDDIGVTAHPYHIRTARGHEARFINYSANIERTRFDLPEVPDMILACEIVEHLIRAPHIMFLNINRWLPVTGKLLVTTPNGAQFSNPFRRRSPTPAYRCRLYERHAYLYTLDALVELVTLCGFKITEAGYWNVYTRHGLSHAYRAFAHLPWQYCRDKFMQTIFVVGEKEKDMVEIAKPPHVYDPRGRWEFVMPNDRHENG